MVSAAGWIVIAGAGGSLGRGFVEHFAAQGRQVLALDLRPELVPQSATVNAVAADLACVEAVDAALDHVPRSDSIDLLVNAVGMIWNEPVVKVKGARMSAHAADSFARVIDSNLTAAFLVATRVAGRMVRKGGGTIINFSSLSAQGIPGQAAYSAAKAGVVGLTRAMAAELGPLSVRVNAIAPGFIDVASTRAALSEQKIAEYAGRTPSGRLGSLEEVIGAVEFLAGNSFINGVVLDVDGGLRP
jgi:3-oxoacyl-[acyl-carrier protein] reductase